MFYLLNIMLVLAINSQSIETPKYTIIEKFNRFEVRDYGTVITAYTTINDEYRVSTYTGFRRIANYIFGGNDKEVKIAMTAPVITEIPSSPKQPHKVHFVMPSEHKLESLPSPNLKSVNIEKENLGVMAAIQFGGWATESRANYYINFLLKELKENDIKINGDVRVAQYNGPMTVPPFRKNEILIPVVLSAK